MTKGQTVTYRSLAGVDHRATVVGVRADGTVDLAVDAGSKHPVDLSKIEVRADRRRGTCRSE